MIWDGSQLVMKPTFSGSRNPLIHGLKCLLHVKHLAVFVFLLDLIRTLWLTLFRISFVKSLGLSPCKKIKIPSYCSCFGRSWWNLSSNLQVFSFEVDHHRPIQLFLWFYSTFLSRRP